MCFVMTDLGIDPSVIEDIVAVRAAGASLEVGREIDVRDSQLRQVVDDRRRLFEVEIPVELEPVRGDGPGQRVLLDRLALGLEQGLGNLSGAGIELRGQGVGRRRGRGG